MIGASIALQSLRDGRRTPAWCDVVLTAQLRKKATETLQQQSEISSCQPRWSSVRFEPRAADVLSSLSTSPSSSRTGRRGITDVPGALARTVYGASHEAMKSLDQAGGSNLAMGINVGVQKR